MNLGYFLITIAILQFTVIPMLADFNRTHAANPKWPAHARFHVVTQVLTTSGLGVAALYFLWSGRIEPSLGVCIATVLALIALCGFFVSAAASRFYGGVLANSANGSQSLWPIDGNAVNFGCALVILLSGRALLL